MKVIHPILNEAVSARVGRRGRTIEDFISPETADALEEIAGALMESAQQVSNGAIQGALTGFTTAGPYGALVGAGLGALAGRKKSANATAPASVQATATASTADTSSPGVNPYAAQLLATLLRPEMIQALLALAIAPRGTPTQAVAGVPVPLGAFTSLMQSLSERAAAEYHRHGASTRTGESWAEYLNDSGIEETEPQARADALLNLLLVQTETESYDDRMEQEDESVDDDDQVLEMLDIMEIQRLGGI